jgi:hypothetical protein
MSTRRLLLASAALAAALSIVGSHAVQAQQAQHFAVLNGGNEVGPTGQAAAGDRNGYGTASVVVVGPSQLCFSIVVDQIGPPVAAHIHRAPAGVNGPIVVPLTPPPSGDPGTSSGCVPGLAAGLVTAIRANPEQFYVNVHTAAFPAGAVRGQLF